MIWNAKASAQARVSKSPMFTLDQSASSLRLPGTVISSKPVHNLPPIIVLKKDQVLMELSSKDFSFVEEKPMSRLHEMFAAIKIRPNLSQNGAISLLCCLDDKPEKIEKLAPRPRMATHRKVRTQV